jgi:DNA-binding NtrC family response regulator
MKPVILYLDDDAGCLNVFRALFADDYDVRTAATPAEARAVLRESFADIIISDQNMPEIEGKEFLREAARLSPHSCRGLLTGAMHVGDAIFEMGDGLIHFFVPKPWTEAEMRRVLERALLRRAS